MKMSRDPWPSRPVVPLTEDEARRAAHYDAVFANMPPDSPVHALFRQAFGDEHPEGINVYSSCTRTTLERALNGLQLGPGTSLVDLGCGQGGPGQWLAGHSGAHLVGVDFSQAALDAAAQTAANCLPDGRYEYRRGTFTATGLPDEYADGVVSIDALPMTNEPRAALEEVRRVLRPGGRIFFTCPEWDGPEPAPTPRLAIRWAPLIAEAGLLLIDTLLDQGESERWRTVHALWLEHQAQLRTHLGDAVTEEFLVEARYSPVVNVSNKRALQVIAERPIG